VDPFFAYQLYSSLRLHFTSKSYDYTKYNGKLKSTSTVAAHRKFEANKQRIFFAQLARHADPEGLLIANLLENPKVFITEIVGPEGLETYTNWKGRQGQLTYRFKNELGNDKLFARMMKIGDNGLPVLINEYIAGRVSPETVVMVDAVAKRLDTWAEIDHPLMQQVQMKLRKYRPFVDFDKQRVKDALESLVRAK
jgi:hypothetical protein